MGGISRHTPFPSSRSRGRGLRRWVLLLLLRAFPDLNKEEGFGRAARGSEERGGCVLSSGRGRDPPVREPPQDFWLGLAGLTRAWLACLCLYLRLSALRADREGTPTIPTCKDTPHGRQAPVGLFVARVCCVSAVCPAEAHRPHHPRWGIAAIALRRTARMTISIPREVRQLHRSMSQFETRPECRQQ